MAHAMSYQEPDRANQKTMHLTTVSITRPRRIQSGTHPGCSSVHAPPKFDPHRTTCCHDEWADPPLCQPAGPMTDGIRSSVWRQRARAATAVTSCASATVRRSRCNTVQEVSLRIADPPVRCCLMLPAKAPQALALVLVLPSQLNRSRPASALIGLLMVCRRLRAGGASSARGPAIPVATPEPRVDHHRPRLACGAYHGLC